jgi:hypothetical protein
MAMRDARLRRIHAAWGPSREYLWPWPQARTPKPRRRSEARSRPGLALPSELPCSFPLGASSARSPRSDAGLTFAPLRSFPLATYCGLDAPGLCFFPPKPEPVMGGSAQAKLGLFKLIKARMPHATVPRRADGRGVGMKLLRKA